MISSLDAGGAQTMLCNLIAASTSGTVRHQVVSMIDGGSQADVLRARGVPVESLGIGRARRSVAGVLRFARVLRRARPDIVQTWMYHADLLGLIGRPVAGARVVWNVRSAEHAGIDSILTRACAWLSRLPDAVVVNSETGQRIHAERGYHPRRWSLIGNGFDLDIFKPSPESRVSVRRELGVPDDTPLIGLVARFDPHKGHDTFLAAAGNLARRRADVRFVLVGTEVSSDNPELAESIAANGLEGRVHLLGARSDIPRLTAALDLASLTSTGEAFPNVAGEAMACGVPCVVTDVGDAARIVDDPELVVSRGDAASLANVWDRLLAMDAQARRAIGARGRQRIATHFTLEAIANEYVALYRSVTGRN